MRKVFIVALTVAAVLSASVADARGRSGGMRMSAPRIHKSSTHKPAPAARPVSRQRDATQPATSGSWWMPFWFGYLVAPKGGRPSPTEVE